MADSRHALVFASILAAALIPVFLIASNIASAPFIFLGVVLVGAGAWLAPELTEFREYERGVVFRYGRFNRLAGPGWTLLFPRFERYERVDLRTQAIDMPPQQVMTLDNVRIEVDAIAFWKVKDPLKVVLEVKDPQAKIHQVLVSQLREAVSKMDLNDVQENTDQINERLSSALQNVAATWGIQVTRVEVQQIELPQSLSAAMRKRQEALEYRAKVETEAMGRQVALETVDKAASKLSDKTLAYLYLDSLKAIADGKSTKILFPLELSKLAHNLSSKLGSSSSEQPDYSSLAKVIFGQQVQPVSSPHAHKLHEFSAAGRAG
jgi:regulator of protease activity HflC (stomatin/prohibitin superfamily)